MLSAVLSLVLAQQGRQIENLPFEMPEAIFPGQREVVLGVLPYRETIMQLIYSKDLPSTADMKGINPPVWDEYPLGFVKWSVKPDSFAGKPCMSLRMEGLFVPSYNFKFKGGTKQVRTSLDVRGVSQWWVTSDGTILRQYEQRMDKRGIRSANCTYGKDSVTVQVDNYGARSATELFPSDMDQLQLQFKPMIVEGKVVMPEKEYLVYDPFTSGFIKRTAKVAGRFNGNYLQLPFEGNHVDFSGLIPGTVKAYISKEGDLVKIDLPHDRYCVMNSTPPGKEGQKVGG
ncbi:hypothetical protein [Fimbriimonas ginsengisoli]|uniref:Uncharacterized protein n=1 Tax=Fimbriimonas ginsengisoli Gsoil 348 TaxID=661478 RepID=A0A068NMT8_FIMGI|nr:hypothetical protein [Fimbriimonas ginsengisoli]AIE84781.1 hypothetical protein OP10G_1413 [Fimbriimonas ginsengisoli Gsoil 348]